MADMNREMPDPLVSTDWLSHRLSDPGVRILDATWFMPNSGKDAQAEFRAARIPGASFFDIDAVADRTTALPHMLPSPGAFAEAMARLSVVSQTTVVAYDGNMLMASARLWWMLRVMGHDRVVVLDGGLARWRAEGRPLSRGPAAETPLDPEPARFVPQFRPELVRIFEQLRADTAQVIDARPAPRFRGEAAEPRPGLKSGHMPDASNLPYLGLLTPEGRLKSAEELGVVFAAAGVDVQPGLTTSCGSGVTACVVALALARLGRWDTSVYDGSWAEWGGRADAPVVTGPAK